MATLTIDKIKKSSGIYDIPSYIHVNKGVIIDVFLFRTLQRPDYEVNHDYHYDFEVFLKDYGGIPLQRPYVWKEMQQTEFLLSIFQEKPMEPIVVVQHIKNQSREDVVMHVIDGKQRLLTIQKFIRNEIPVKIDGEQYLFCNLDDESKRLFRSRVDSITGIVYYSYPDTPVTDEMKVKLFNYYNFSGTPQTKAHKIKLANLLKKWSR